MYACLLATRGNKLAAFGLTADILPTPFSHILITSSTHNFLDVLKALQSCA
jgi:hypothetical protein